MAVIVELPRLSDTMEEGVIAKWHVAEGDKVKRGQVIADVETDKATMEFESFDAGVVLKLVAREGDAMPIGTPIAVLGKEGEDAEAALAKRGGGVSEADQTAAAADERGESARTEAKAEPSKAAPAKAQRDAAPTAHEAGGAPKAEPAPAPAGGGDDRIPAPPLARRLAREHGLTLAEIQGSGPNGRIVKEDVEAAAQGKQAAPAASASPSAAPQLGGRPDEPQKLSQMRKAIARRMSQANTEIPHFYLTTTVDMGAAVAMREQLKSAMPDVKISFNDLVLVASVKALKKHPEVNAYWDGQTIVRRGEIHLGVAVAIDEGLIVPVIRFAGLKSLSEIASGARDLGQRAREKKLAPEEMSGSTFTVSNLGMFGITEFAAVVNPGEGAILAVGAISDTVVVENGQPAVGKRMQLTLSCDHRVMDGAVGAKFLATLRGLLESPLSALA